MPNPVSSPVRNFSHHLAHALGRFAVVADHLVDLFRQKIAHRAFDQVRFFEDTGRDAIVLDPSFHGRPLLEQKRKITYEIAGALPLAHRADDDANAFGDIELAQNLAQTFSFLRILDLARDAAPVAERHEHEIAPGKAEIGRDARPFRADRAFRHLHDHLGADRIDAWDIARCDLFLLLAPGPIDFLDAAVERGGDGVPEMEERVLFEADVDEHRLQTHLDVLDATLVDAPDNVAGGIALDAIFFETPVLQERDTPLEFLHTDDDFVSRLASRET